MRTVAQRWALALVAVLSLMASPPAAAETIGLKGLMGMPAFRNLAIAIGNLNRAMRDAAENPMDQWRRQNVRAAMGAMPAAIIGLANEFKAGKLHDADLPTVQAILGGFIDVNAADGYKKFLQNPSADLIPRVGDQFPAQLLSGGSGPVSSAAAAAVADSGGQQGVPGSRGPKVGFDDSVAKGTAASGDVAEAEAVGSAVKDLALKSAESRGEELDRIGIGFNDEAAKGATAPSRAPASSGSAAAVVMGTAARATGSVADAFLEAANEGRVGGWSQDSRPTGGFALERDPAEPAPSPLRILPAGGSGADSDSLDQDFFQRIRQGEESSPEETDREARLRAERRTAEATDPKRFKLRVQPKYWNLTPVFHLAESLLIPSAHAQGGQGGCQGGNCGGGEGGGGGGNGAQYLFGVAAIISAIAPMVTASIQASADKAIAKTNAQAQITMTQITSDTSKFLANQQKEIALTQTAAAQQIAQQNNAGVTQRLNMQLAELRAARDEQAARERERLAYEQELNQQRIELANKQAEDNLNLAKQTLNAQLTQAGLSTGFSNSRNSGSRLQVGRIPTTRPPTTGTTETGTDAGTALASAGVGNGLDGLGVMASQNGSASNSTLVARNSSVPTSGSLMHSGGGRGVTGAKKSADEEGRQRLLQSVGTQGRGGFFDANGEPLVYDKETGEWVSEEELKKRLKKRGVAIAQNSGSGGGYERGVAALSSSRSGRGAVGVDRQLNSRLTTSSHHQMVRGSSPEARVRITSNVESSRALADGRSGNGSSDLGNFLEASRSDSFIDFRNAEQARRSSASRSATELTASGGHSPSVASSSVSGTGRNLRGNAYNPPGAGGGRAAYSTAISQ